MSLGSLARTVTGEEIVEKCANLSHESAIDFGKLARGRRAGFGTSAKGLEASSQVCEDSVGSRPLGKRSGKRQASWSDAER
jgi:hypothetical protein